MKTVKLIVLHFLDIVKKIVVDSTCERVTAFLCLCIQGVPGGRDKTSGECSLC